MFHRWLHSLKLLCSFVGDTNVFERLPQLAEIVQALLHHSGGPLVQPVVLVDISPNGGFY